MAYTTGILLGVITKVSGFQGAVLVRLERALPENITIPESVFLEIEGRPVPFFINIPEYTGSGSVKLKFDGFDTDVSVSEFVGARVFLTGTPSGVKTGNVLSSINGFKVYDQDDLLVGCITEVIPNPGQMLLKINSPQNREILIPLHENLIIGIDKRKKQIIMDIPEGLTEIN
jgi:16S rRNA processing protein RimM